METNETWSFNDIVKNRRNWSLASDAELLKHLQLLSNKLVTKSHDALENLHSFERELDHTCVFVSNVNNHFRALTDKQFIESKVQDDFDVVQSSFIEEKKVPEPSHITAKLNDALSNGIEVLNSGYDIVAITDSDSEDEGNEDVLLKCRNPYMKRRLPVIIGSEEFTIKDDLGLVSSSEDDEYEEELDEAEIHSSSVIKAVTSLSIEALSKPKTEVIRISDDSYSSEEELAAEENVLFETSEKPTPVPVDSFQDHLNETLKNIASIPPYNDDIYSPPPFPVAYNSDSENSDNALSASYKNSCRRTNQTYSSQYDISNIVKGKESINKSDGARKSPGYSDFSSEETSIDEIHSSPQPNLQHLPKKISPTVPNESLFTALNQELNAKLLKNSPAEKGECNENEIASKIVTLVNKQKRLKQRQTNISSNISYSTADKISNPDMDFTKSRDPVSAEKSGTRPLVTANNSTHKRTPSSSFDEDGRASNLFQTNENDNSEDRVSKDDTKHVKSSWTPIPKPFNPHSNSSTKQISLFDEDSDSGDDIFSVINKQKKKVIEIESSPSLIESLNQENTKDLFTKRLFESDDSDDSITNMICSVTKSVSKNTPSSSSKSLNSEKDKYEHLLSSDKLSRGYFKEHGILNTADVNKLEPRSQFNASLTTTSNLKNENMMDSDGPEIKIQSEISNLKNDNSEKVVSEVNAKPTPVIDNIVANTNISSCKIVNSAIATVESQSKSSNFEKNDTSTLTIGINSLSIPKNSDHQILEPTKSKHTINSKPFLDDVISANITSFGNVHPEVLGHDKKQSFSTAIQVDENNKMTLKLVSNEVTVRSVATSSSTTGITETTKSKLFSSDNDNPSIDSDFLSSGSSQFRTSVDRFSETSAASSETNSCKMENGIEDLTSLKKTAADEGNGVLLSKELRYSKPQQTPGKLAANKGLNINVSALMPGSSWSKVSKQVKSAIDETQQLNDNGESSVEAKDSSNIIKSTGVGLSSSIIKNRVKVRSKRPPSRSVRVSNAAKSDIFSFVQEKMVSDGVPDSSSSCRTVSKANSSEKETSNSSNINIIENEMEIESDTIHLSKDDFAGLTTHGSLHPLSEIVRSSRRNSSSSGDEEPSQSIIQTSTDLEKVLIAASGSREPPVLKSSDDELFRDGSGKHDLCVESDDSATISGSKHVNTEIKCISQPDFSPPPMENTVPATSSNKCSGDELEKKISAVFAQDEDDSEEDGLDFLNPSISSSVLVENPDFKSETGTNWLNSSDDTDVDDDIFSKLSCKSVGPEFCKAETQFVNVEISKIGRSTSSSLSKKPLKLVEDSQFASGNDKIAESEQGIRENNAEKLENIEQTFAADVGILKITNFSSQPIPNEEKSSHDEFCNTATAAEALPSHLKIGSANLFSDSSTEDLFSASSVSMKPSGVHKSEILTKTAAATTIINAAKKNRETKSTKLKKNASLFDDDGDDDLFSSKRKFLTSKIVTSNKLFEDDDDDDLFMAKLSARSAKSVGNASKLAQMSIPEKARIVKRQSGTNPLSKNHEED